jgi:hypothetical protein
MRRVDGERSVLGTELVEPQIGPSEEGWRVSESGCQKGEQRSALGAPWALGPLEP